MRPKHFLRGKKFTDLRVTADHAWSRVKRGVTFNTRQLQKDYKLNKVQTQIVKRKMREHAAEEGLLWGYVPRLDRYMLAPNAGLADEIITYMREHWREAGNGYALTLQAAYGQGYISAEDCDSAAQIVEEFNQRIPAVNVK